MEETENEVKGVRFVGDPSDDFSGPSKIEMFGHEFEKGEWVGVSDPNTLRKLRGHSHFEIDGEKRYDRDETVRDELAALGGGTGGLERLRELADSEGVEYPAKATKAQMIALIREHREDD